MAEKLTVGQKLLLDFISNDVEGVITKVGRRWADVAVPSVHNGRDDMRIDMDDLRVYVPGRSYPLCRAFLSLEDRSRVYAEERAKMDADMAWDRFKGALAVQYGRPDGISADTIRQAAALLGIQLPTDTGETP